jgi:hypothetical protein
MGQFNAIKATYAKLNSGDWGVRVEARLNTKPAAGDTVLVRKASGETKTEAIDRVVWSGSGVHLCAIRRPEAKEKSGAELMAEWESRAARSPASGGEKCAECGRGPAVVECSDSSGIRAKCCRRCASMASWERSFA